MCAEQPSHSPNLTRVIRVTSYKVGSSIIVLVKVLVFLATAVQGDARLKGGSRAGGWTQVTSPAPRVYIYEDAVLSWKMLIPRCLAGSWKDSQHSMGVDWPFLKDF